MRPRRANPRGGAGAGWEAGAAPAWRLTREAHHSHGIPATGVQKSENVLGEFDIFHLGYKGRTGAWASEGGHRSGTSARTTAAGKQGERRNRGRNGGEGHLTPQEPGESHGQN